MKDSFVLGKKKKKPTGKARGLLDYYWFSVGNLSLGTARRAEGFTYWIGLGANRLFALLRMQA